MQQPMDVAHRLRRQAGKILLGHPASPVATDGLFRRRLVGGTACFAEFRRDRAKAVAERAVVTPILVHPAVAVGLDSTSFEQMNVESIQNRH